MNEALIKEALELGARLVVWLSGQSPEEAAKKIAAINAALAKASATKGDTTDVENTIKGL